MKKNLFAILIMIPSILACAQSEGNKVSEKFAKGKRLSQNLHTELKEVSGLASSRANPGMMWVQNDSGNEPEIYLINNKLEILFTCRLEGIQNRDWEDIAVGPGPEAGRNYVYVGDIGDNKARHPVKYIYRFEEPVFKAGNSNANIAAVDRIMFRLPDAMKDTESLIIDHKTKDLYIISKREEPVTLYQIKYPFNLTDTITAVKVMTLPYAEIVSADVDSRTGDILIKNYDKVYYWQNTDKEVVGALLKRRPVEVPYEKEPQGEAIAWAVDGSGFFTISEKEKKQESWLYFYQALK